MNIFDKIKEIGKKQVSQISYDEYNQTKDRQLMNLRRTRREQLERLEKEKLQDEIKNHNQRELVAYNQGKKLSEVKDNPEQQKEGFFRSNVVDAEYKIVKEKRKPKIDYKKLKKTVLKQEKNLRSQMYSETKSQLKALKKKAKKQYKSEWTIKRTKEREPENASFMYQNFFRPSNPEQPKKEESKNFFFR